MGKPITPNAGRHATQVTLENTEAVFPRPLVTGQRGGWAPRGLGSELLELRVAAADQNPRASEDRKHTEVSASSDESQEELRNINPAVEQRTRAALKNTDCAATSAVLCFGQV